MTDPLAEVVALLQPQAPFSKRVLASAPWAVRRTELGQPFYFAVLEGGCQLHIDSPSGGDTLVLQTGDFVLIPAAHSFATASLGRPPPRADEAVTYERMKDKVSEELKRSFRPEFLNRIDEVVVFHALDQAHIESIAKIQLKGLEARIAQMDMKLDVSPAALAELAKVGFDPVFGARPLKRAIQQRIENPVAKLILQGQFGPKDVIPVDVDTSGHFQFARVVH